jgi:hypothetical protein
MQRGNLQSEETVADYFPGSMRVCLLILFLIASLTGIDAVSAEYRSKSILPLSASTSDFGGPGVFQTRTARMEQDGLLEVGYSRVSPYKRYYISLQALPWLTGTFRYSELTNHLFSEGGLESGTQTYKDRGADLGFQLIQERKYLPAVGLILQDGIGTGIFSAEHLVASKRIYDFDFSGGLIWGYGSSGGKFKNPMIQLAPEFASRSGGGAQGGTLSVLSYLSGQRVGVFGSVIYSTPIEGLTLSAEFDPNDFQDEPLGSNISPSSHYNYGFQYRPWKWLDLSYASERGQVHMFRMTMRTNLHDPGMPKFGDLPPKPVKVRKTTKEKRSAKTKVSLKKEWVELGDKGLNSDSHLEESNDIVTTVFDEFETINADVQGVDIVGGQLNIKVKVGQAELDTGVLDDVSGSIFKVLPDGIDQISLTILAANSLGTKRYHARRQDFQNAIITEFLFEELEEQGIKLIDLAFTENHAEINISTRDGNSFQSYARVARVFAQSLPTPVQTISVSVWKSGEKVSEAIINTDQVEVEASVDELFDALARSNIALEDVESSGRTVSIKASLPMNMQVPDYEEIAGLVNQLFSRNADNVSIVFSRGGVEISRLMLKHEKDNHDGIRWVASAEELPLPEAEVPIGYSEDQKRAIANKLFAELATESFLVEAMELDSRSVIVYGSLSGFRQLARNIGRAARIISNNMPPEIEEITIVPLSAGMRLAEITLRRKDLERSVQFKGSPEEIWAHATILGPEPWLGLSDNAIRNWSRYPSFRWSLSPKVRSHVGGPDQFLLYQFWLAIGAQVDIWRGLSASGQIGRNLYNNFDKITLTSDSVLPRVRSNIKQYLQQGENNLVHLQMDYIFSPLKEFYARMSVGYFEEMYGGVSGEILHRPFNSRFAIGLEVNKVRQRSFDQRLTFQKYSTITGHLGLYYDSPWYNILASMYVGQYLAGDRGVTYNLSRAFDSGVRIGAWATLTNVSAEDFGEGSFDKGFYVTLPLELFLTKSSTRYGSFSFRPLTRDGGQMVNTRNKLYDLTGASSHKEIVHDWSKFLD